MTQKRHFPVYLNLDGKQCLVVGGGQTALSKAEALLEAGAEVFVIAREADAGIQSLARESKIVWLEREFEPADANEAFLVVSTLDDRERNQEIFDLVDSWNRLVNVHDDAPRCNFIYPAVAKSGPIQVAVSTSGKSPAMAQRIRNRIFEEILTEGVGDLVDFIGSRRTEVQGAISSFEKRVRFWRELLDSDFPQILAQNVTQGKEIFDRLLNEYRDQETAEEPADSELEEARTSPENLTEFRANALATNKRY